MQDGTERLFDEHNIITGRCYSVSFDDEQAFVKIIRKIPPNPQGTQGPAKWMGQRVVAVNGNDEGREVEFTIDKINGLARKRDLCAEFFRQGWTDESEIYDYLRECGIEVNIRTISSYKSQYKSGTLYSKKTTKVAVAPSPTALQCTEDELHSALNLIEEVRICASKVGGPLVLRKLVNALYPV